MRDVRHVHAFPELVLVDDDGADAPDHPQLELPLQPAAWSRMVSRTVARAARYAGRREDDDAVFAA